MYTLAVFLDLSKAFDSLEHSVLTKKLEKYGIRGVALKWYESYLSNREIRVKCKVASSGRTEFSAYQEIKYGVPQGSCLGPLIFLIFTNDLYHHVKHSSTILFADDTTLHKTHRDLQYLKRCLEQDLANLLDWFYANKLTLNLSKTICVLFQQQREQKSITLEVNGWTLKNQPDTKFLGIWLDQNLKWTSHIQKVIIKLRRNQNLLKCTKHYFNKDTKKLIYHAHIESHLRYGLIVWGNNATKKQLNKIRSIQKECLTLINGRKTNKTLSEEGLLSIDNMISLENMKFGYKLINNLLPTRTSEICKTDHTRKSLEKGHAYGTRNKNVPNLPRNMNKTYRDSFLCRGPQSLLALTVETKNKLSLTSFVKSCKQILIN